MRISCLSCARKHLSKAEALMDEAQLGYPLHAWLAIGQMSEAEDELLKKYPEMANVIRAERINYVDNLVFSKYKDGDKELFDLVVGYDVDILMLIGQITLIEIEEKESEEKMKQEVKNAATVVRSKLRNKLK